jgi:hypothetical protein
MLQTIHFLLDDAKEKQREERGKRFCVVQQMHTKFI